LLQRFCAPKKEPKWFCQSKYSKCIYFLSPKSICKQPLVRELARLSINLPLAPCSQIQPVKCAAIGNILWNTLGTWGTCWKCIKVWCYWEHLVEHIANFRNTFKMH
jgi:hypothetical protein